MDAIIEFLIEVFGEIAECILDNIRDTKKRKWALTIFYSTILLAVTALCVWGAVTNGIGHNTLGAVTMGVIAGLLLTVFGFLIVRGHRRSWRKKAK